MIRMQIIRNVLVSSLAFLLTGCNSSCTDSKQTMSVYGPDRMPVIVPITSRVIREKTAQMQGEYGCIGIGSDTSNRALGLAAADYLASCTKIAQKEYTLQGSVYSGRTAKVEGFEISILVQEGSNKTAFAYCPQKCIVTEVPIEKVLEEAKSNPPFP